MIDSSPLKLFQWPSQGLLPGTPKVRSDCTDDKRSTVAEDPAASGPVDNDGEIGQRDESQGLHLAEQIHKGPRQEDGCC